MISTNQRCKCGSDLSMVKLIGDKDGFAAICVACLVRRAEMINYSATDRYVDLRLNVDPPEIRRIIFQARHGEVGN